MTSKAEASFVCKSFGSNLLPNDSPEVGISAVFKKKQRDATLGLQLNDATLRDPKSAKGVVLSLEKPLGGGCRRGCVGTRAGGRVGQWVQAQCIAVRWEESRGRGSRGGWAWTANRAV
jgi:hypothetical protein